MKVLLIALFAISAALAYVPLPRGAVRLDGRIVGGKDTTIEEHPHQVSITVLGIHFCGGSVVSPTMIVTAAHCTEEFSVGYLKIRAGSTKQGKGGVLVQVKKITVHEQYDTDTVDYDVALLELEEPLTFSDSIGPVALPAQGEAVPVGTSSVVTGWGTLSSEGEAPITLQEVSVPIISQTSCTNAYPEYTITPRMVCAGVENVGGKDACQGDSGGPLVALGKLHGIVSWGLGCAEKDHPGVYTRVSEVTDWIKKNAGL